MKHSIPFKKVGVEHNRIQEEEKMNIDPPSMQNLVSMEQLKKMVYDTNIIINYK